MQGKEATWKPTLQEVYQMTSDTLEKHKLTSLRYYKGHAIWLCFEFSGGILNPPLGCYKNDPKWDFTPD